MATIETFNNKVLNVADKYADYIETQISALSSKDNVSLEETDRLNEGMRMLAHLASTIKQTVR